jgi:putative addiction module killer protein
MHIETTAAFDTWLKRLRDQQGRAKILARFDRLLEGNPGDIRALGDGVVEMRIDSGPGYRVYFRQLGLSYVMLCGGDKSTQARDIAKAKKLARDLEG